MALDGMGAVAVAVAVEWAKNPSWDSWLTPSSISSPNVCHVKWSGPASDLQIVVGMNQGMKVASKGQNIESTRHFETLRGCVCES